MASPTTATTSVTALYRGLLREVNKQVTKKNGNPLWRTYVAQQFRTAPEAHLTHAQNALLYLSSHRTHRELLEGYFPKLSEDERLTRTVAKVGLQLPRMFDPDGEVARDASSSSSS
ncbi:hypothetical protein BC828DRAFT_378361 [Blastocladiella britannica]|nr:hypothetical protein BC828DRAFT_378361 [Blastocladiella britannica]